MGKKYKRKKSTLHKVIQVGGAFEIFNRLLKLYNNPAIANNTETLNEGIAGPDESGVDEPSSDENMLDRFTGTVSRAFNSLVDAVMGGDKCKADLKEALKYCGGYNSLLKNNIVPALEYWKTPESRASLCDDSPIKVLMNKIDDEFKCIAEEGDTCKDKDISGIARRLKFKENEKVTFDDNGKLLVDYDVVIPVLLNYLKTDLEKTGEEDAMKLKELVGSYLYYNDPGKCPL